jgi:hypothetical protein
MRRYAVLPCFRASGLPWFLVSEGSETWRQDVAVAMPRRPSVCRELTQHGRTRPTDRLGAERCACVGQVRVHDGCTARARCVHDTTCAPGYRVVLGLRPRERACLAVGVPIPSHRGARNMRREGKAAPPQGPTARKTAPKRPAQGECSTRVHVQVKVHVRTRERICAYLRDFSLLTPLSITFLRCRPFVGSKGYPCSTIA